MVLIFSKGVAAVVRVTSYFFKMAHARGQPVKLPVFPSFKRLRLLHQAAFSRRRLTRLGWGFGRLVCLKPTTATPPNPPTK